MWVGLWFRDLSINNAPSLELAFKAYHHCSTYSEPAHFTGSSREPAGFHLLAVWLFQLPEFLIWPTHSSLLEETGGTQGPAVLLGDVTRALKHRLPKCALPLPLECGILPQLVLSTTQDKSIGHPCRSLPSADWLGLGKCGNGRRGGRAWRRESRGAELPEGAGRCRCAGAGASEALSKKPKRVAGPPCAPGSTGGGTGAKNSHSLHSALSRTHLKSFPDLAVPPRPSPGAQTLCRPLLKLLVSLDHPFSLRCEAALFNPCAFSEVHRKRQAITHAGEDVEKREPSYTIGGNSIRNIAAQKYIRKNDVSHSCLEVRSHLDTESIEQP
ncbi:uncharacterized protein LOC104651571 [Saimiri boliviensis]|uniref:uncharacterized protein LOC104651571 n=1 Tax=Saimiri boliviensis TaxID=27679 RepID=UPI003D78330B